MNETPYILFLNLGDRLAPSFYQLSEYLKHQGFVLIPIKWDQLQVMKSASEQNHLVVVCSVANLQEYKIYQEKVFPHLRSILRSTRISFISLSSFESLRSQKVFTAHKNFFLISLPLSVSYLAKKLARYYELKSKAKEIWPGGRRSKLPDTNA